jgi:hypothetical protein
MHFKEFITRQRVIIVIVGIATFVIALFFSHLIGFSTLGGALFVNLAASSITIVFTALIIDYLGLKEASDKTQNAAGLAEDEIKTTCFRIKWRLARLFGLERHSSTRDHIGDHQEAIEYLEEITTAVENFLARHDFINDKTSIKGKSFIKYRENLESAQTELEQVLILYEYAMPFSFREHVLALRKELRVSEQVLGFIDTETSLNSSNLSLIRITAQSIYDAIEAVLAHSSRIDQGVPIHSKGSKLG